MSGSNSLLLVIWIMQIYSTYTIAFYAASLGLSQIFNINMNKCLYLLIPIVFIISTLPQNITVLFAFGDLLGNIAIYLFVSIPVPIIAYEMEEKEQRMMGNSA